MESFVALEVMVLVWSMLFVFPLLLFSFLLPFQLILVVLFSRPLSAYLFQF